MRLAALEELLYDLMTAPTGVGPGLAARGLTADALDALIAGDARLSATARLDIYANMYFFRILDVLREEYPRVATAVGANPFHDLVTDFLLAERPAHPSLREAGGRLPSYLARHPLGLDRPRLAALAALERTHRELFDGPDAPPLTMEEMRATPPEAFATLLVRLVPAHRILRHDLAISGSWTRLGEGDASDVDGAAAPETLLVWRQDVAVRHRVVDDPAEEAMLTQAAGGTTLGALCEGFGEARRGSGDGPAADDAAVAAEAFQILARWIDDGLLTAR